jgi:hypothetical protein
MSETATITADPGARHVTVRDGMEWGMFFWRELETPEPDGRVRHSATWAAVTSFGTFGNHWSHAGSPFAQFVARIDGSYLLSKISRKVTNHEKLKRALHREIFIARASREDKSRASKAFRELAEQHSGDTLAHAAYLSDDVNAVSIDWADLESQDYPPDARGFTERLWPKFVAALQD